jgi:hypothetical protein
MIDIEKFENTSLDDLLEDLGFIVFNKREDMCNNCGSDKTNSVSDSTKGIILCYCGQVIDYIIDNSAEKRYNDEGTARCAVMHNTLLPQSSLGTSVHVSGKLRKLQTWCAMPYKERSNNILYKKIDAICDENKILKMVEFDAKLI